MKYRSEGLKDNAENFEIEDVQIVTSASLRAMLYNHLIEGDKTKMGTQLRSYLERVNVIDSFWTIRQILDFQSTYFYDDDEVVSLIRDDNETLYRNLELWLDIQRNRDTGKSSGICDGLASTSAKIDKVVGNIAVARNLYDSLMTDISGGDMIKAAKTMVDGLVDSHVQQIRQKINSVKNLLRKIDPKHGPTIQKALRIRDELESMSGEDAIKKIKEEIEGQIGFIMGQFEELDPAAIKHVMNRACLISQNISKPFDRKSKQIDSLASYYGGSSSFISNSSAVATQQAINAGAYRYNPSTLASTIPSMQQREQASVESIPGGVYDAPPSQEEIEGVTMWNSGKGDDKVRFSGPWVTKVGMEGWTRVDYRVKVKLMRLHSKFGKQLTINSAYRPPAYNASVGGATNSYHMKGHALDVTWNGFNSSQMEEFIVMAKACGFTGIGRYPHKSFVHIDIGNPRSF